MKYTEALRVWSYAYCRDKIRITHDGAQFRYHQAHGNHRFFRNGRFDDYWVGEEVDPPEEVALAVNANRALLIELLTQELPKGIEHKFYHPLDAYHELPRLVHECAQQGIGIISKPVMGGHFPIVSGGAKKPKGLFTAKQLSPLLASYMR